MYQAGLILEGGGMKGVYTAGVLDFFLDRGIEFSSVYGVSAGAVHMCSYLSRQRRRAFDIAVNYLSNEKYCGTRSLLTTGDFFNVETCYHKIPQVLNPYDYEAFNKYQGKAYSVATNIETGKPEYFRIRDMKEDIDKIRASASLPLMARNVKIDGHFYLDGGISDAIPVKRSMLDGNSHNIVIMTKEEGYIRRPSAQLGMIKMRYLSYPKVYELMKERHLVYNVTQKFIAQQQACGGAFVIRPRKASDVGRLEKDVSKLEALYQEGYKDAEECFEEMMNYLESADAQEDSI